MRKNKNPRSKVPRARMPKPHHCRPIMTDSCDPQFQNCKKNRLVLRIKTETQGQLIRLSFLNYIIFDVVDATVIDMKLIYGIYAILSLWCFFNALSPHFTVFRPGFKIPLYCFTECPSSVIKYTNLFLRS